VGYNSDGQFQVKSTIQPINPLVRSSTDWLYI